MKFKINQDYHIHSYLSKCSVDPKQNAENILKYAVDNDLSEICITDHFWDENVEGASGWYASQNFEHISKILPLPKNDRVKFYFGCETEMDKFMRLGISRKAFDKFDFVIIPTTHLHMTGFTIDPENYSKENRAKVFIERLVALLDMNLPFHKIGIAHLTGTLIDNRDWQSHLDVLNLIDYSALEKLFKKAADLKVGIELNLPFQKYSESELKTVMKPYEIAKKAGCKFYFGSDAHHPKDFVNIKATFQNIADYLSLTQENRFNPFK